MNERIVLLGCGDVAPVHEPMAPYSTLARPILATGDPGSGSANACIPTGGRDPSTAAPRAATSRI